MPNVGVDFLALNTKNVSGAVTPGSFICEWGHSTFRDEVYWSADNHGFAWVRVRLGSVGGPARIVVKVDGLPPDTVTYFVSAGTPTRVDFEPSDTGVTVGGEVYVRAGAVDRFGNRAQGLVSYTAQSSSGIGTVTQTGGVLGTGIGQLRVVAKVGALADSGTVEVVPAGTIAALDNGGSYSDSTGIVKFNLDGSGYTWLARAVGSAHGYGTSAPSWTPSGAVIYSGGSSQSDSMRLLSASQGAAPVVLNASGTPGANHEGYPEFNAKTGRIFYSAAQGWTQWRLWERSGDGTLTPITPEPPSTLDGEPSASPDGTRLAYITGNPSPVVRVFDLAHDTVFAWSAPGQNPSWSPQGDRIALLQPYGGPLLVVNADGTNLHEVSARTFAAARVAWSPDGTWILGQESTGVLDLVNSATGATIPLKYLSRYLYPAWKH